MPSTLALLQRYLMFSSRKLAEKHLGHARQLLASQDPADIHTALGLLDTVLKLFPQWEKAIELKARALLCLRRFKDIANLLQESIPSLKAHPMNSQSHVEDKITLLPAHPPARRYRKTSLLQCFLFPLHKRVWMQCSPKGDREQWKYIVLGQACCHLGMMEDAMILLSKGKRAASVAYRKQSSHFDEDSFSLDGTHGAADVDLVSHLLGNIKLLLRRRTAALAALDAGLYMEAARHFSKIIDGRRGTPQGFIAECYMHRAVAYQAAIKIIDAIADCNRSIALNPLCVEALSTRANLYETIGCLSDALHDLERLKALYETIIRNNIQWVHAQSSPSSDLEGCIDFISGRLASISERITGYTAIDHFQILGVSRGCSRLEVERAYLLLSLKHRPDKAAHFVDRCEFVDERDIEAVKDEARALGMKLFKLLQKSYTWVMSLVLEEEMNSVKHIQEGNMAAKEHSWKGMYTTQHIMYNPCFFGIRDVVQSLLVDVDASGESTNGVCLTEQDGNRIEVPSMTTFKHEKASSEATNEAWLTQQEEHQIDTPSMTTFKSDMLESHTELEHFSADLHSFDGVGHLVDANLFTTCRELANMGTILSQGLPSEAWMGSNDWNHQGHATHALSVT